MTCPCFRYIIGRGCHECHFCSNKHAFVAQTCVCHDRCFVTKCVLLSQQKFCCNRITFVTTNCCSKRVFVMTHTLLSTTKDVLSQQTCVCCDKNVLVAKKTFVVKKICLSWQRFCHDRRNFVTPSIFLYGRIACQQFDLTFSHTCLAAGTLPCPHEPVSSLTCLMASQCKTIFLPTATVLCYRYCVTSTVLPVLLPLWLNSLCYLSCCHLWSKFALNCLTTGAIPCHLWPKGGRG